MMNNYKNKVWPIAAGSIFALAALATVGLMMKVAGLDMLPMKYFVLAVLVSFVVGMVAIKTLMEVVKKIGYEIFAIYRVLLGAALIIVYLVRL